MSILRVRCISLSQSVSAALLTNFCNRTSAAPAGGVTVTDQRERDLESATALSAAPSRVRRFE